MSFNRKLAFLATALGAMGALAACASFPTMTVAPEHATSGARTGAGGQLVSGRNGGARGAASQASTIPGAVATSQPLAPTPPATAEQIAAITTDQPINASLPPQPLAQFLNTAFNDVLKIPYSLGPDIATRTQIITLNAPPSTSKRAYLALLQTTLRSYGLVMSIRNGGVLITDDAGGAGGPGGRGGTTTIVRSRSSSDTPLAARSVMQIFQLVALQADAVQPLVQNTLGTSVSISVDSAANALVIQGSGRMVANAVDLIHNLDEPAFAGAQVVRLEPLYWSAPDFATALQSALQAEGYIASSDPLGPKSIMILPMASTSQVLVFAADRATMARVQYWSRELDQPSAVGAQNSTFVYDVQNTSATTLGQMLIAAGAQAQRTNPANTAGGAFPGAGQAGTNVGGRAGQVNNAAGRGGAAGGIAGGAAFGGAAGGGRGGALGGVGGAAGGIGGAAANSTTNALNRPTSASTQLNASGLAPTGGSITVDDAGNRIVFTGSPSEYAALHTLLQRLDSPTREVLVEVTVAEVTLTDETRAGLDFFFSANHNGSVLSGGTATFPAPTTGGIAGSGLSLGTTGATLNFLNAAGDLRAEFNAFAENNKVNVLSRPHLTATSGSSAQIEVGDQVPIITSQAASGQTTGGTTDTLQTVQYRQTGVTLSITPIIYGDDRVDITIDQEVADVRDNPNTAIGSPIIGSRSVTTTLTLADGRSAVLGGLMQDSYSKDNKGIPFLKDIPILGQAFRNDDINGAKTELVVLITPFIIRDANDMSSLANQMTNDINKAFQTGRGASYTLTPFALGRGFGIGAPDPNITGASLQRPQSIASAPAAPNAPPPTPSVDPPLAPPPSRP
jgi:general secretion pathway protein D